MRPEITGTKCPVGHEGSISETARFEESPPIRGLLARDRNSRVARDCVVEPAGDLGRDIASPALCRVESHDAERTPVLTGEQIGQHRLIRRTVQVAAADQFASNLLPIIKSIQSSGPIGMVSIAKLLNERGIRTARGGQWHVSSVANLLARANNCAAG